MFENIMELNSEEKYRKYVEFLEELFRNDEMDLIFTTGWDKIMGLDCKRVLDYEMCDVMKTFKELLREKGVHPFEKVEDCERNEYQYLISTADYGLMETIKVLEDTLKEALKKHGLSEDCLWYGLIFIINDPDMYDLTEEIARDIEDEFYEREYDVTVKLES